MEKGKGDSKRKNNNPENMRDRDNRSSSSSSPVLGSGRKEIERIQLQREYARMLEKQNRNLDLQGQDAWLVSTLNPSAGLSSAPFWQTSSQDNRAGRNHNALDSKKSGVSNANSGGFGTGPAGQRHLMFNSYTSDTKLSQNLTISPTPEEMRQLQHIKDQLGVPQAELGNSQSLPEKGNSSKLTKVNDKEAQLNLKTTIEEYHKQIEEAWKVFRAENKEKSFVAYQGIIEECLQKIQGNSPYEMSYKTAVNSLASAVEKLGFLLRGNLPAGASGQVAEELKRAMTDLGMAYRGKAGISQTVSGSRSYSHLQEVSSQMENSLSTATPIRIEPSIGSQTALQQPGLDRILQSPDDIVSNVFFASAVNSIPLDVRHWMDIQSQHISANPLGPLSEEEADSMDGNQCNQRLDELDRRSEMVNWVVNQIERANPQQTSIFMQHFVRLQRSIPPQHLEASHLQKWIDFQQHRIQQQSDPHQRALDMQSLEQLKDIHESICFYDKKNAKVLKELKDHPYLLRSKELVSGAGQGQIESQQVNKKKKEINKGKIIDKVDKANMVKMGYGVKKGKKVDNNGNPSLYDRFAQQMQQLHLQQSQWIYNQLQSQELPGGQGSSSAAEVLNHIDNDGNSMDTQEDEYSNQFIAWLGKRDRESGGKGKGK